LKDGILTSFIKEEVDEDVKIKAGASVYKARKGFIAHLINLAMKLREVAETNSSLKRLIESILFSYSDPEFSKVYESFFEKEVFNSKKSLAGFSMRKDIKHEIMFQKEVNFGLFRILLLLMLLSSRNALRLSSSRSRSTSTLNTPILWRNCKNSYNRI
jgi:hypothetical protein